MMAHRIEQSLRCDMCGTAPWEWDPKQGGSLHAYDVDEEFCVGCNRKHNASEGSASLPGTTVILTKRSRREKAQIWVRERNRAKKAKADRQSA